MAPIARYGEGQGAALEMEVNDLELEVGRAGRAAGRLRAAEDAVGKAKRRYLMRWCDEVTEERG